METHPEHSEQYLEESPSLLWIEVLVVRTPQTHVEEGGRVASSRKTCNEFAKT